jgi:putative ABC transport system substrate-binding protein
MNLSENDPEGRLRFTAFIEGLKQSGWIAGSNVRVDTRWASGDAEKYRKYAAELVALSPAVIMAAGSAALGPLLRATRTVPIVFTQVIE